MGKLGPLPPLGSLLLLSGARRRSGGDALLLLVRRTCVIGLQRTLLGSSMGRDLSVLGSLSIAFGSFPPPSLLSIVVPACTSPFTLVGVLLPKEAAGVVVPSPAESVHLKAEPRSR